MDRTHLERAAVAYAQLRGLLLIPVGALLLVAALANEDVLPVWSFPAALVVAGAVGWAIVLHYRARYGRVRVSARQQWRDAAAIALAVVLVVAASVLLGDTSLNPMAIAFALALLASYALGAGVRAHHVVVLGALLVAGLLPVWDGDDSANAGLVLAGIATALTGLLDHRSFVHTFGPRADAGA